MDNKHNSLNLAAKICPDVCPCSLLGTDNVRGQISEHIFAPNEGYCLYIRILSIGMELACNERKGEYIKNYLHLKRFPRINLHCMLVPVQY